MLSGSDLLFEGFKAVAVILVVVAAAAAAAVAAPSIQTRHAGPSLAFVCFCGDPCKRTEAHTAMLLTHMGEKTNSVQYLIPL